jgi:L-serine dehydratase
MDAIKLSIFDIFKIGPGPSSSHTIGPMSAAYQFIQSANSLPEEKIKTVTKIEIYLYGSLSATGKGHGTDRAVVGGLLGWQPHTCDADELDNLLRNPGDTYNIKLKGKTISFNSGNIHFDAIQHSFPFQNTIIMRIYSGDNIIFEKEYYSIGGGFVKCKGEEEKRRPDPVYPYGNMKEFKKVFSESGIMLDELIMKNEMALTGENEKQINKRLDFVISVMMDAVEDGIHAEGILPGPIKLARKAHTLYKRAHQPTPEFPVEHIPDRFMTFLNSYSMAAAEENAAGHKVVTAPTLGSCGVIPGVLYLLKHRFNKSKQSLRSGMLAAALISFIVKSNASISGAEVGCQGEIGVASAMAAALLVHANGYPIDLIENAAEIALEHHLGMTCDPIGGYVQIPCIERNAVAAVDAYNAYLLASAGDPKKQKIHFDEVVEAMFETGKDMSTKYKETAQGGLAVCTTLC